MAGWIDFLSLTATIGVIGGIIYGVIYVIHVIEDGWASTKQALKTKGLDVSKKGVSVKTSRRFDREDYLDATHRGIVRAVGASSFRKAENTTTDSSQTPPKLERASSESANSTSDGKKKKGIFRSRK
ncbi:hypothetical protein BYT27DRAFT_7156730 [Phlegmacium glaucopus]|nr:hypothetical protein BYT27DRAFT_7156730 [Phlegmacium glaucopus]